MLYVHAVHQRATVIYAHGPGVRMVGEGARGKFPDRAEATSSDKVATVGEVGAGAAWGGLVRGSGAGVKGGGGVDGGGEERG